MNLKIENARDGGKIKESIDGAHVAGWREVLQECKGMGQL